MTKGDLEAKVKALEKNLTTIQDVQANRKTAKGIWFLFG